MKTASYIALGQNGIQMRHLDMIANNIANSSTNAFRGERASFGSYMVRQPDGQTLSYVRDKGARLDTREGDLLATSNNMDVGIRGAGYLVAKTADGVAYTRNGRLRIDLERRLTTDSGRPLLGERGGEVRIDGDPSDMVIARNGIVSVNGRQIDRLQVVKFDDEQSLQKTGDGLYTTDKTPAPAPQAEIRQGMIETSNVRPVVELTAMMAIVRNYQGAQNFLDGEHQRQLKAIRELPRADQG